MSDDFYVQYIDDDPTEEPVYLDRATLEARLLALGVIDEPLSTDEELAAAAAVEWTDSDDDEAAL